MLYICETKQIDMINFDVLNIQLNTIAGLKPNDWLPTSSDLVRMALVARGWIVKGNYASPWGHRVFIQIVCKANGSVWTQLTYEDFKEFHEQDEFTHKALYQLINEVKP